MEPLGLAACLGLERISFKLNACIAGNARVDSLIAFWFVGTSVRRVF